MTSPNLHTNRLGALDALYDDIEHALLDLTTASLDNEDGVPAPTVDEFATDFLIECSPPQTGGRDLNSASRA
jgi:hypothetical protein